MSPFAHGAADAGAAAARAIFARLMADWSAAVATLDYLVAARAEVRGIANPASVAAAQVAALDGLSGEFDRLTDDWRGTVPVENRDEASNAGCTAFLQRSEGVDAQAL